MAEVFGLCSKCGDGKSFEKKATFCTNYCVPDGAKCYGDKNKKGKCVWSSDRNIIKAKKCVNPDTKKRCHYEKISSGTMVGAACPYDKTYAKCKESKNNCHQCTPCSKIDQTATISTQCYMAIYGKILSRCVFNYVDKDGVEKRDNCEPPATGKFTTNCPLVPSTPGVNMQYVVEKIPEG
eukprot:59229_1